MPAPMTATPRLSAIDFSFEISPPRGALDGLFVALQFLRWV
jgi:hypothetical protein